MQRVVAVIVALLLCLGAPAVAAAQFGPNAPAPLLQEDPKGRTFEEDRGLSTMQLVLIFGGAAAVVALIAGVIVRDARGKAPAQRPRARSKGGAGPGSTAPGEAPSKSSAAKAARERERQKARKRNKAKAARNQRKHNRPR